MTNRIKISGNSSTNKINVKSSNNNNHINTVNNAAWHYAELARQYAEQTLQDVDEIIDGMNNTGNITLVKNGRNVTIGTKYYVHEQAIASNIWVVQHNLNKLCPKATVVDTAGTIFYPSVKFIDKNNCQIVLIGAMAGTAYLE